MSNKLTITKRIQKIREYIRELRKLRDISFEEFSSHSKWWGSGERLLQLCIEILIDVGTHIVVRNDWGSIQSYHDVPEILFKQKVIDKKTSNIFSQMIGFRNILVHEYLEIDKREVFETIQHDLEDIEKILKILKDLI